MSINHTIPPSMEADTLLRDTLLRAEDYQRVLNQIRKTYVGNHGKLPLKMRQLLGKIEADLQTHGRLVDLEKGV